LLQGKSTKQGKTVSELSAAQFLITAGENIDRLGREASFARLCRAAPVPDS
jgi:transposase